MNSILPSSPIKVLIKYRLWRLFNLLSSGFKSKPKDGIKRNSTATKEKQSWIIAILLSGFILFQSGYQAHQIIQKTDEILGQMQIIESQERVYPAWNCGKSKYEKKKDSIKCIPIENPSATQVPQAVAKAIALELLLLLITAFLLNIASKELTTPEWDMEWLVTLPIPLTKLIGLRFIERAIVNPSGLLLIWPFITALLWKLNFGYISIVLGFVGALALLFFESMLRTLIDTGLRMVVPASTLRNFQAVTSLIASTTLLAVMSVGMGEKPSLFSWSILPELDWLIWTPMGLITQVITSSTLSGAFIGLVLLSIEIALIYFFISKLLLHLLRFGIVVGGNREGIKRKVVPVKHTTGTNIFSPLQRRELKLLLRDQNFMVQTLVLPIFIMGMQFFMAKAGDFKEALQGSFSRLAATAFGAAAYSLIFSVFQVLNTEGKSLWILYTFPNQLENLLREKVYLWLFVALLYPIVLFSIGIYATGIPNLESLLLIVIVLLGIPIYGTVAACFGVFASNPLAENPRHRSRLDYTYLYMILAGFYTYAIFAKSYWDKMTLLILSALMSLALFQKARDHLPYLLDPTESPKSNVSLSDGLIAALIFFVIQGISTIFLVKKDQNLTGNDLLTAFVVAGAITFTTLRTIYWRKKTTGVPQIFGEQLPKAIAYGIISGIIAGINKRMVVICIDRHSSSFI
ncbi:MAG: hypothetical protein L6Q37_11930 [Bdellovibrionaceae bacterium]|nr:hypothetical protein [Pseudobdellovibrionaceae bacterium]